MSLQSRTRRQHWRRSSRREQTNRGHQRQLRSSEIALIIDYGTAMPDGYLMRARDVAREEAELKHRIAQLRRLKGTRVVLSPRNEIVTYRLRSPRRAALSGRTRRRRHAQAGGGKRRSAPVAPVTRTKRLDRQRPGA